MKTVETGKPKRRRRRRKPNALQALAYGADKMLVEAALEAKKIATLQRVVQLLEEVKAMLAAEGFEVADPLEKGLRLPNQGLRPMAAQPNAHVATVENPCVECGREGIWEAPSTQQWFCIHHEALGKGRYADDKRTQVSPTLRVVQTPQTAQRAVVQPPPMPAQAIATATQTPPVLMETVEGGAPVLQEQPAATGDALRDEMNRLMNGG